VPADGEAEVKPPAYQWRAWLYASAWLTGGIVGTGLSIWHTRILLVGWPLATAPQRIGILGNALYMTLSIPLLVMLGLGLRNAIRNLKGSAGIASIEVSGHDSAQGSEGQE
jgi:hypothetical protein